MAPGYLRWVMAVLLLGCASGGETATSAEGGANGLGGAGGAGGSMTATGGAEPEEPGFIQQSCPDGSYAKDIDDEGMLSCAPFDGDVATSVEEACSLYWGWRDGCNGCTSGPAKYGSVGGASCANGAGADNTCTSPTLGAATVSLFGLNTDGDVDGNDMFHLGWFCQHVGESGLAGPCEEGEHAVRITTDGFVECIPTEILVADYVREHCTVYLGWRDGCSGCPDPPSKWGSQRDVFCEVGAGADNACSVPFLDAQWVPQIGINTDGDVDDNDTFYVGMHCDAGSTESMAVAGRCPFGTLVTGLNEDGTLQCGSVAGDVAPVLRDDCRLYLGYRDGCGGCTDAPVKWGSTNTTSCDPAVSATCGVHDLGGVDVNLLGVRTDGDVDGNDKLYVGLTCN